MQGLRMCCWNLTIFQLLLLISLTLSYSSEARNVKHLNPSVVIVGKVYCDTCFQDDFSRRSQFISGATISVECKDAAFKTEAKTDQQGKFKVHLPTSISKHEKEIKDCQVRLIKSNDPYCAVASAATSYSIHLKSRKQGIRVFSAGFFTFKPLKQPDLCNQQPSINPSTKTNTQMNLLDPPVVPVLPIPPGLPIPPVVPGVPGFPVPPVVPAVPSLPIPPAVPGLLLPPGLPILPVLPGDPPAKKVSP